MSLDGARKSSFYSTPFMGIGHAVLSQVKIVSESILRCELCCGETRTGGEMSKLVVLDFDMQVGSTLPILNASLPTRTARSGMFLHKTAHVGRVKGQLAFGPGTFAGRLVVSLLSVCKS